MCQRLVRKIIKQFEEENQNRTYTNKNVLVRVGLEPRTFVVQPDTDPDVTPIKLTNDLYETLQN